MELCFYFSSIASWCAYQYICGEHEGKSRSKVLFLGGVGISVLFLLYMVFKGVMV